MKKIKRRLESSPPPLLTNPEPEAVPVDDFARRAGVGRTLVYRAMSSNPDYRGTLPYLPSMKLGRARRIRLEAGRAWLRELEAQTSAEAT
jgi:hypothetical protein